MKKIGEKNRDYGPVRGRTTIFLECSKDEQTQIRNALAVMSKVEKVMNINRRGADWTMYHSFHFDKDGIVSVVLEQGACG